MPERSNDGIPDRTFVHSMLSGGCAGLSVDCALYPLDTIKTRMQSSAGFFASGGFTGIYRGLSSAALGSAPGAALFFTTYESAKQYISPVIQSYNIQAHQPITHCIAACMGEITACIIRVPTENIKQKMQVGLHESILHTTQSIIQLNGIRGFYNGYITTLMREIPFSLIQFPLYEAGKSYYAQYTNKLQCAPYESAMIGSCAGGIAAAITTPIDVAKTRIMLNQHNNQSMINVIHDVYRTGGVKKLFSGVQPRVAWISIGGFVFFGAYETAQTALNKVPI